MRLLTAILLLGMACAAGCTQVKTPDDWQQLSPTIERFTELTFRAALVRDDVKENKEAICNSVVAVAGTLARFEDPDVTFASIRQVALQAIRDLPPDAIPENVKPIALLVVDGGLDFVFLYARDSYEELLAKDEARVVMIVTNALATGMAKACVEDTQLRTFRVTVNAN